VGNGIPLESDLWFLETHDTPSVSNHSTFAEFDLKLNTLYNPAKFHSWQRAERKRKRVEGEHFIELSLYMILIESSFLFNVFFFIKW